MVNLSSRVWARVCKLALGLSLGFAASCAAPIEEGELEDIGTVEQRVTGWETLTLLNGWTAIATNPPRVAKWNNVIVFRGAASCKSSSRRASGSSALYWSCAK